MLSKNVNLHKPNTSEKSSGFLEISFTRFPSSRHMWWTGPVLCVFKPVWFVSNSS